MQKHIEQTDRGIVISKNLAWTMGVAFVLGGIWVGTNVATVNQTLENMTAHIERQELRSNTFDIRLNALERTEARTEVILNTHTKYLESIDERLRELKTRLNPQDNNTP